MSALLPRSPAPPVDVPPGASTLLVGANTHLAIHVSYEGAQDERTIHTIQLTLEKEGGAEALIDPAATMRVVAPCAAYTHPSQEPNDHSLSTRSKRMALVDMSAPHTLSAAQTWTWIYVLVTLWPDQEYFVWRRSSALDVETVLSCGLAIPHPDSLQTGSWAEQGDLLVPRAAFWQGAGPFVAGSWVPMLDRIGAVNAYPMLPMTYKHGAGPNGLLASTQHPLRPLKLGAWRTKETPDVPLYRRYIPALQQTLTFRLARASCKEDVDLLHKWHATERVNTGWRQDMPWEDHKKYLENQEASSDSVALIGEWDGEPFGYVEIYHVQESPLRNFFDAGAYDCGFHALVGEEKYRGPHRVRSWMGSVIHLLFLLDARTMRVVSEPRASNTKMVEYECLCGGHVEKVCGNDMTDVQLIDLPHKRAALVWIPRERFFQLCPMGPLNT